MSTNVLIERCSNWSKVIPWRPASTANIAHSAWVRLTGGWMTTFRSGPCGIERSHLPNVVELSLAWEEDLEDLVWDFMFFGLRLVMNVTFAGRRFVRHPAHSINRMNASLLE
jgi:hypothetical protein